MSRAARRQKSEAQLRSLEEQFSAELVAELRECASGTWGLFGRNDLVIEVQRKPLKEMLTSKRAEKLIEDGDEIQQLRQELGLTEFPLFRRFLDFREMHGSNVPGEPKLAAQFLEEIGIGMP